MAENKANHICKNPLCKKAYYACDYCDRTQNWKSVACSRECYNAYENMVIEARTKGVKVNTKPNRTDMTEKEVDELLSKPVEEVLQKTKEDLKDYVDEIGNLNVIEAVDKINEEINKKKTTTRSRQKKEVENE